MKKLLFLLLLGSAATSAMAQDGDFYAPGKRVGIGVGVGLEGIGIDAAVSLTKWCSARVGVTFMPGIASFKDDFDVETGLEGVTIPSHIGNYNLPQPPQNMQIEGEATLKRTYFDVKFDLYPFPNKSSFFVSVGASFGGNKLIKIKGHSDELGSYVGALNRFSANPANQPAVSYLQGEGIDLTAGINIDGYKIPVNENGDLEGGAKVKGFRPYLGLGFGRTIPKNRLAFRFELGASFQGKPEIYADGVDLEQTLDEDTKDDISDILDYLKVYPVMKFSIRGRIL